MQLCHLKYMFPSHIELTFLLSYHWIFLILAATPEKSRVHTLQSKALNLLPDMSPCVCMCVCVCVCVCVREREREKGERGDLLRV